MEGSLLDLQDLAGDLSDPFPDSPTVLWLERQRLQNQQVQGPLQKINACCHLLLALLQVQSRADDFIKIRRTGGTAPFPSTNADSLALASCNRILG